MMDELKKMMAKKKSSEGEMSEMEQQAKLDVIMELLQMAEGAMGSKVKGGLDEMQKISVMAPDKEGLAEGLDLAKEVTDGDEDEEALEKAEELTGKDLDGDSEEGESPEHVAKVMEAAEQEEEPNPFAKKRAMMGRA